MQVFCTEKISEFGGRKVERMLDYNLRLDGLPKSDVLKLILENHSSVVVRPSGTEPKLKTYIADSAEDEKLLKKLSRGL